MKSQSYDRPRLRFETLESRVMLTAATAVEAASAKNGAGKDAKAEWTYSLVGTAADSKATPTPGLALMGGGTDVDLAFKWMAKNANGGDFVVLSAGKDTWYNKYISGLGVSLDSVATLVVPTENAANAQFVRDTVSSAEAIFITGGDQADYVDFWDETQLEDAIYSALARGATLGGTSAGLAVLGQVDFASRSGTITSAEALANPSDPRIDLYDGFLNSQEFHQAFPEATTNVLQHLNNAITDSHFMQRDRMGRTMAFMANMDADGISPRAIGINEQTALLIDGDGDCAVVGNPYSKKLSLDEQQRSVYLLQAVPKPSVDLSHRLTYTVMVQQLTYTPGTDLDHLTWTSLSTLWPSSNNLDYTISADTGVLSSSLADGAIYGHIALGV
jgi:cyanophycinase